LAKKTQPQLVEPAVITPIYFTDASIEIFPDGAVHVTLSVELRDLSQDEHAIQSVVVGRLITTPETLREMLVQFLTNDRKKAG
jgi:hypothetical protein